MGIDIYMYAERRTLNGWSLIGEIEPNSEPMGESDEIEPLTRPVALYDHRNRDLFAILAGISAWTFDNRTIKVIAPPRGIPSDLSPSVQTWYGYFENLFPNNSWLSLPELLETDWHGNRVLRTAVVSKRVAPLFRDSRHPFPHAKWPVDEPVAYGVYRRDGVTVQWTDSYAQIAGKQFMEKLDYLHSLGDPAMTDGASD